MKRTVEIFTAGCPVCDPVVQLVKDTACDNCDIIVYDLAKGRENDVYMEKIRTFGIKNVPSVVINGKLLDCCNNEITKNDLANAGIGNG